MRVGRHEKSETEPRGRRTAELLRALGGLGVTEADLKNQVHRGFLIPPGEDGVWSAVAVARAKRCFRLRRRGAKGPLLKILLFAADGYGWEGIRKTCIEGFKRITALSLLGVDVYGRNDKALDFSIPDIVEYQHETMLRKLGHDIDVKPTSEETTRFAVGLLRKGESLKGGSGRRLMGPLLRLMHPDMPEYWLNLWCSAFDVLSGLLGLSISEQVARLERATPEQIENARRSLRDNIWLIRKIGRRLAGPDAARGQSFNILTGFGHAKEMDASLFSVNNVNVTPKFMLGGCIGGFLSVDIAFREFLASWERLVPSAMIVAKQFFGKNVQSKAAAS